MLNDREQQELQRIEEALKADDKRFAQGLRRGPRIDKTRRWPARALLGFGIALIVIGALTSAAHTPQGARTRAADKLVVVMTVAVVVVTGSVLVRQIRSVP